MSGNRSSGKRRWAVKSYDAQVRKNYSLSLPNELSATEEATRIEAMLKETPIKDCSYSICIHRGEKDGVRNLHVLVNERNLITRKKDRQMIKRRFWSKNSGRSLNRPLPWSGLRAKI